MSDTNLKHWNEQLSEYIHTNNTILNIRPNKGETTSWFLNNLCINSNSLVLAIDTWEENEHIFNLNVNSTGKITQLIKIKNDISTALVDLITTNLYRFNIIYMNSSYDALTVYNDIILLWQLLNDDSIIIFDEYLKGVFKIPIDYFIQKYLLQVDILYENYQLIIRKNTQKEIKLELKKDIDTINKINSYTLSNLSYQIRQKINLKLEYRLILSDKPNEYLSDLGYNDNYKLLLSNFDNLILEKNRFIEMNCLLNEFLMYKKMIDIVKNISNQSFNPYKKIYDIHRLLRHNNDIAVFENLNIIFDNNLLTIKKKFNFLNFTHSYMSHTELIVNTIKKLYPNIHIVNYYDVNISTNKITSLYKTKLYNIDEINKCIQDINNKMNLIVMALFTSNEFKKIKKYLREKYYTLQFFYSFLLVISLLKKNGTCILMNFSFYTEISIELLYILKKYFKKLVLTRYNVMSSTTATIKIIASRFKGISKEELDELFKIGKELSSNNNKYDNYDNDYKFIQSIIDININRTSSMYKLFRAQIINFNIVYKKVVENNITLFNQTIDIYKHDNLLLEEIIMRKQIEILFLWFNRYKLLRYYN
jgi:hypothetical protein